MIVIELSDNWGETTHQLVKEFDEIGGLLSKFMPHTDVLRVDFDSFSPEHEWPYKANADETSGSLFWFPEPKLNRADSSVAIGGLVVDLAFADRKKVRSTYRFAYCVDNGAQRSRGAADIDNSTTYDDPSKIYERQGIAYWGYALGRIGGGEAIQEYLETIRNTRLIDKVVDLSIDEAVA